MTYLPTFESTPDGRALAGCARRGEAPMDAFRAAKAAFRERQAALPTGADCGCRWESGNAVVCERRRAMTAVLGRHLGHHGDGLHPELYDLVQAMERHDARLTVLPEYRHLPEAFWPPYEHEN